MGDLTQHELKSLLRYEPDTGNFIRLTKVSNRVNVGDVAGGIQNSGYISIKVSGKYYRAHRLAWLYTHGMWPNEMLDHINGDKADNRLCNLRECSRVQNGRNQKLSHVNTSGFKGVCWHKASNKWMACIGINKKQKHLGLYYTAEDAAIAYDTAAREMYGEFAKTNFPKPEGKL